MRPRPPLWHTLFMTTRPKKLTRDVSRHVKMIVDLATGNPIMEDASPIAPEKNPGPSKPLSERDSPPAKRRPTASKPNRT